MHIAYGMALAKTEGKADLQVEGGGKYARYKLALTGDFAITAAVLLIFGALWYWKDPPASVVPLIVLAGVVGYFLARGTSRELLVEKDREIQRRDKEIERKAAHSERLETKLLNHRMSS